MGRNTFTLEPRFRERFPLNRRALKDAFHTVDRGEVTKAKRKTRGGNIHRVITVRPDGNGDVTITLPETADCDAGGAICTEDGRMLSAVSDQVQDRRGARNTNPAGQANTAVQVRRDSQEGRRHEGQKVSQCPNS